MESDRVCALCKAAREREDVRHAQCWMHTRRKFFEAQGIELELAEKALKCIGILYEIERGFPKEQRSARAQPVVDEFFLWLRQTFQHQALLPSSPFAKAAPYALEREEAL